MNEIYTTSWGWVMYHNSSLYFEFRVKEVLENKTVHSIHWGCKDTECLHPFYIEWA